VVPEPTTALLRLVSIVAVGLLAGRRHHG
jgi:hypothetical protein